MFTSSSSFSSSSTSQQKNTFSVPLPRDYEKKYSPTKKAKFLYESVLGHKQNSRYFSDSEISGWLGYSGKNGSRDIGNVLAGTAFNLEWRVSELEKELFARGLIHHPATRRRCPSTSTSASNKNSNNVAYSQSSSSSPSQNELIARAKSLIDMCRRGSSTGASSSASSSSESGCSDALISEWLQFSGAYKWFQLSGANNAARDINNVLVGTSHDLEWRLDCLQSAMEKHGILSTSNHDDVVDDGSRPSQEHQQQKQEEETVQQIIQPLPRLKCDLPKHYRPVIRTFSEKDARSYHHQAFVDDSDNDNNDDDDTPPPIDPSEMPICSTCLEEFQVGDEIAETVLCKHMFHKKCVSNWFHQSNSPCCPYCGQRQIPHGPGDDEDEGNENNNSSSSPLQKDAVMAVSLTNVQMQRIWDDAVRWKTEQQQQKVSSSAAAATIAGVGGARQNQPEQIGQGGTSIIYKGLLSSLYPVLPNIEKCHEQIASSSSSLFVAIKVFNPNCSQAEFDKEVANLNALHHTNILQALAYCKLPQWKCIIFPFLESIQVDRVSGEIKNLPEEQQRLALMFDIALAVEYLHSDASCSKKLAPTKMSLQKQQQQKQKQKQENKKEDETSSSNTDKNNNDGAVAHRDIKIQNILLAPREPQKQGILGDLGCARRNRPQQQQNSSKNANNKNNKNIAVGNTMTKIIGTDAFLDPALMEYAKKNNVGNVVPSSMYFPADIFSLGITFATLCWQRVPQNDEQRLMMLQNLERAVFGHDDDNNNNENKNKNKPLVEFGGPRLITLIRSMTHPDQQSRPTAKQVVDELGKMANDALSERQRKQSASNGQNNRPLQEVLCQSCYGAFRDVAFVPCGHHVYCAGCCIRKRDEASRTSGATTFRCPFCNVEVTGTVNVAADAPTKVLL